MIDDIFDALANEHRRRLLLALRDDNPQAVPDPASADATANREETDRHRAVAMRHVHLPKLAAAGLVEVDEDAGRVVRGPQFDEVRPLLNAVDEHAVA